MGGDIRTCIFTVGSGRKSANLAFTGLINTRGGGDGGDGPPSAVNYRAARDSHASQRCANKIHTGRRHNAANSSQAIYKPVEAPRAGVRRHVCSV